MSHIMHLQQGVAHLEGCPVCDANGATERPLIAVDRDIDAAIQRLEQLRQERERITGKPQTYEVRLTPSRCPACKIPWGMCVHT